MISVCAHCQRLLDASPEERLRISHGVCEACQLAGQELRGLPVLVVARQHAALVPALERVMHETAIPVVLDRRRGERRVSETAHDLERREGTDRRRRGDFTVR